MFSSLAAKLTSSAAVAMTIIMLISGWITIDLALEQTSGLMRQEMTTVVNNSAANIRAYFSRLEKTMNTLSRVFMQSYEGVFSIDEINVANVPGREVPNLMLDGSPVSYYSQLDAFSENTGGTAALYVNDKGSFVCIESSETTMGVGPKVGAELPTDSKMIQALSKGESFIGKVRINNEEYIASYQPIKDKQDKVIGASYVGLDLQSSLAALRDNLSETRLGEHGYLVIINTEDGAEHGRVVLHPKLQKTLISDSVARTDFSKMESQSQGWQELNWSTDDKAKWSTYFVQIPELHWMLAATQSNDELASTRYLLAGQMLLAILITIVLLALTIHWSVKLIVSRRLVFAKQVLDKIATRDYTQNIVVDGDDEICHLLNSVKAMQEQIKGVLAQLGLAAEKLQSKAAEMLNASEHVVESSDNQNKAAGAISSSVEQLSMGSDNLSSYADDARDMSVASYETANKGGGVITKTRDVMKVISGGVHDASERINELGELSGQISKILEVISTIAEQTNLLALNAAIEAARAGEQGRGFAVVADEVRNLAARTTESAKEITATIKSIQERTDLSVNLMATSVEQVEEGNKLSLEAGDYIEKIKSGARKVNDSFEGITDKLKEQRLLMQTVSSSVDTITIMTEENSSSVAQLVDVAEELRQLSDGLNQLLATFVVDKANQHSSVSQPKNRQLPKVHSSVYVEPELSVDY